MPRRLLLAGLGLLLLLAGAAAAAYGRPGLDSRGPTSVAGTEATSILRLGGRTIRSVRYADRGELRYSFEVRNQGWLPVRVEGLAAVEKDPRLFTFRRVENDQGDRSFTIPPRSAVPVDVVLFMSGCETLSARAASIVTGVPLRTSVLGLADKTVRVTFPEELHTGSPREAFCPGATATSRPPG